ncbi:MAG: hypothetical protein AAFY42_08310 [Pseudomonadota bacterium]
MTSVTAIDVPAGSLLAQFGKEGDYRDCFVRDVRGEVSLETYIERFYHSRAFLPERLILKALGKPASSADATAFARGETHRFGVWKLVERAETEMLALSKDTNTASWFSVETGAQGTRLYFGSWVGSIGESGWKALLKPHVWYSRELLGAVKL